jgi:hypothetical protein
VNARVVGNASVCKIIASVLHHVAVHQVVLVTHSTVTVSPNLVRLLNVIVRVVVNVIRPMDANAQRRRNVVKVVVNVEKNASVSRLNARKSKKYVVSSVNVSSVIVAPTVNV